RWFRRADRGEVEVGVGDHQRGGGYAGGGGTEAEDVAAGVDVADLVAVHQQAAVRVGQDRKGQPRQVAVGRQQQPAALPQSSGQRVKHGGPQLLPRLFLGEGGGGRGTANHVPCLGWLADA